MKYKTKILILFIVILALFLPFFIKNSFEKRNSKEFLFNENLIEITGLEQSGVVDDWKRGDAADAWANDDGTVTIKMTEGQRKRAIKHTKANIKKERRRIKKLNNNYDIKVSEDYSVMNLYYDRNMDEYSVNEYILHTAVYCAYIQVLSGKEDWFITVNIYNCYTGKLVATGDNNNDIHYNNSDWEASE